MKNKPDIPPFLYSCNVSLFVNILLDVVLSLTFKCLGGIFIDVIKVCNIHYHDGWFISILIM